MAANPNQYFQSSRDDVAALIPPECVRVLDVGCGFGGLGRTLAQRGGHELYGVEVNAKASMHLAGLYRQHWIGDVEAVELPVAAGFFDCIVFADILEHLIDPWAALSRYATLIKPGGVAIASIPNVRNFALLARLIVQGRWKYENSGLLDRTHLRFFTRREIEEMFHQAGLSVEAWRTNRDRYSLPVRILAAIPLLLVPELSVCQFLVRARRS